MGRWFCLAVIALSTLVGRADGSTFQGLGFISGTTSSGATSVSADGSVVVGGSGVLPIRWTSAGGMVALTGLSYDHGSVWAISNDGAVAAGSYTFAGGTQSRAFRWTSGGDMVSLGLLSSFPGVTQFSEALDVSADGSVVVGDSSNTVEGQRQLFRWTSGGMTGVPFLTGHTNGQATGVSADGSVLVGFSAPVGGSTHALRWTGSGAPDDLGFLPTYTSSIAADVSGDGSVVVGESYSGTGLGQAFRWTSAGMVGLGVLAGASDSIARSVSADGATIVGTSTIVAGSSFTEIAFIWDESHGMRNLRDVLVNDYGLNLVGWSLRTANISADGQTLVGFGVDPTGNTEAWRAQLSAVPEPSTLVLIVGGSFALLARLKSRRSSRL